MLLIRCRPYFYPQHLSPPRSSFGRSRISSRHRRSIPPFVITKLRKSPISIKHQLAAELDPQFTSENYCYPNHRHVAAGSIAMLRARLAAYHAGEISFAELHASIQSWMAHDGYADSWGVAPPRPRRSRHPPRRTPARGRGAAGAASLTKAKKAKPALARRLAPRGAALSVVSAQGWATHTTRKPMKLPRSFGVYQ